MATINPAHDYGFREIASSFSQLRPHFGSAASSAAGTSVV